MLPEPKKIAGFHSKRSPSTAHRWVRCIGSVEEEDGLPDNAGEEAIQGTVFHDYAADCLEIGLDPWVLVGDEMLCEDGEYRPFTKEMADKMISGLDTVWALADSPGAELYVERRVNLENWVGEDESGTADAFVIDPFAWRLTTFDWKWGAGVPVSPEHNEQATLYTGGVWDTFAEDRFRDAYEAQPGPKPSWEEARDSIEVVIIIEQPRAPGGGGVWRTKMGPLLKELKRIRKLADQTMIPGQPRTPGEKQCKFCKAAFHNTCKARAEYIADMTGIMLDELEDDLAVGAELDLADRKALTPAQRSQILLHEKLITAWLKSLHEEAMEDAKAGRAVPGMKRVPGRSGARKWADDAKAEIMLTHDLKDDAWEKKLLSPAKVEGEVGKAKYKQRYDRLAVQTDPKPILVPENDPRQAIPSDDDLLDDLLDEDNPEDLI
jgi:hypothetical protein